LRRGYGGVPIKVHTYGGTPGKEVRFIGEKEAGGMGLGKEKGNA